MELELDLLVKDFEKRILVEKEEFFKTLDSYQKTYVENIDYVKSYTEDLVDFQHKLKYYSNSNNLFLKLAQ